ncbi:metalloregulator ArsR/SmtB family transcription factor [Aetokthonos hydrillicola Thurmond2011]|jgi:DNA-binding transcriptional ArsR family regulator|uniref:Metalloregulator ArsR/SmtB family transcription factor n=1 Tax=Aetokthonos hydrillicola Thurmond2011 TaxID=2712845 RepID=A0AAP5IGQ6_9CYAN|nr:metalloregulator ArsR/SmtB family transcription factor [Aetokthonos hydrillicola]MBO3459620.1 winged helix-turn-helix transcriptional regulator [Aetokthonos hydrillicola CCALA 1050]MBW4588982.1 metalloregulator ArsR/SmtB family transcription factor [Aetokthonos hydrillicola CCALA 1050]MDR9900057.1 metalloregulator ArsR/SmtB family transcription factor [Aetokthonos hydrillicola Thurmond2011]
MEITLDWSELETLASRFRALADPTRLQILGAICTQEYSVQEICSRTGLHQGNVFKHLRLMKEAGVVACRRQGVWRYYRVIDTDLLALCTRVRESLNRTNTEN